MDDLLSTGEVARLCGVSTDTIRRWVKLGIIGYKLVGNNRLKRKTIRIPRSEAERNLKDVPAEI